MYRLFALIIVLIAVLFWTRSNIESYTYWNAYTASGELSNLREALAWHSPLNRWSKKADREFQKLLLQNESPQDSEQSAAKEHTTELLHLYYQGLFRSQQLLESRSRKERREIIRREYLESLGEEGLGIALAGRKSPQLFGNLVICIFFFCFLFSVERWIRRGFHSDGSRTQYYVTGAVLALLSLLLLAGSLRLA